MQEEKEQSLKRSIVSKISMGLNLLSLYPCTHPEVVKGVDVLIDIFKGLFAAEEELVLGVSSKGWIIKELDLSKENIHFGGSARELHRRNISAIVFHRGLTKDSLLKFFMFATLPNEKIESEGGLVKIASKDPISNINLFELDYDKYLKMSSSNDSDFFDDQVAMKTIIDNFDMTEIEDKGNEWDNIYTSQELAVILNQIYKSSDNKKIEMAVGFLKELGKHCLKDKDDVKQTASPQKFSELISQLNPNIIRKITYSIKNAGELPKVDEESVNVEYDPYRNRLLDLFNSLAKEDDKKNHVDDKDKKREIRNLFYGSKDKALLSSDGYRSFIKESVETTGKLINAAESPLTKYSHFNAEVSEEKIKTQTFNMILDLLDLENDADTYKKLIDLLVERYSDALIKNDYTLVLGILKLLNKHEMEKESDEIREIAYDCSESLFSHDFIKDIAKQWAIAEEGEDALFKELLKNFKYLEVIDVLKELTFSSEIKNEKIFVFLSNLISRDIAQIEADLKSDDEIVIKNAIKILKLIKTKTSTLMLKSLFRQSILEIRELAFEALVNHNSSLSYQIILERLNTMPLKTVRIAAAAIGRFGDKDIFQALEPFLLKKDLLASSFKKRLEIIEAIGKQKNANAIAILSNVFTASPFFLKSKNQAYHASILNALAKIGTKEAFYSIALLSKNSSTFVRLTGDTLLEGRNNDGG